MAGGAERQAGVSWADEGVAWAARPSARAGVEAWAGVARAGANAMHALRVAHPPQLTILESQGLEWAQGCQGAVGPGAQLSPSLTVELVF